MPRCQCHDAHGKLSSDERSSKLTCLMPHTISHVEERFLEERTTLYTDLCEKETVEHAVVEKRVVDETVRPS